MQDIANRAGVNKALLHYYFRSKDKLYESALLDILVVFWNTLEQEIAKHPEITDLNSTIRIMVETYIRVMSSNPYFPRMLIREIADGGKLVPILLKEITTRYGNLLFRFTKLLQSERNNDYRNPAKVSHLLLNIMGMCIITFLMQPVSQFLSDTFKVQLTIDEQFINERIKSIISMINDGVFSKDTR